MDQCLQQHVVGNPEGGPDIRSFCTRRPGHLRPANLSNDYLTVRGADHYDENTGRWWDRDGYDHTDWHPADESP